MTGEIESQLKKYKQKGVLIDANLLLLWFVGSVNRDRIEKFERTQNYNSEDFDLLSKILVYFDKVVTTPNILTEVNSLLGKLRDPEYSKCLAFFANAVTILEEHYVDSQTVVQVNKFTTFGLTDCGIVNLARNKYLVLTDDLRLAVYLQKLGIDTVNFNNIRPLGWR